MQYHRVSGITRVRRRAMIYQMTARSLLFMCLLYSSESHSTLRDFGDAMQIVNPVIALLSASQEKGVGHFAIIYGEIEAITQGAKYIGNQSQWKLGQRPCCSQNYQGMPSGHTASAWSSAAYVRTFSHDYTYLILPLYASSVATAYSRVRASQHTTGQVVTGALLAEAVTFFNYKLKWSQNYQPRLMFSYGEKQSLLLFLIKF